MNYRHLFLAILVCVSTASAQVPDTLWSHLYGNNWGTARSLAELPDHGYIIAGQHAVSNMYDYVAVRTDSLGHALWTHSYPHTSDDWLCRVVPAADGGFLLAGEN